MWLTPLLQGAAQQQSGAITFSTQRAAAPGFTTSQNISIATPSADQVLVLLVINNTSATISNFTDSKSGVYVIDNTGPANTFFYRRVSGGTTPGPLTVSCSTSSNSTVSVVAFYLNGALNASPLDATTPNTSFGFTTNVSVPITTAAGSALVLAYVHRSGFTNDTTLYAIAPANAFRPNTDPVRSVLYLTDAQAAGSKTLQAIWGANAEGSSGAYMAVAYKPSSTAPVIYRPISDITTTGWSASSGSVLYDMIDEVVPSDTDYVLSPDVNASPGPATFGISSAATGAYVVSIRAMRTTAAGQIRVLLKDSGGTTVGTSSWQTITGSFATYTLNVTTTGTAAQLSIEVQP